MNWGSVGNFLSMNGSGHAPFIWSAYGLLLAVVVLEALLVRRRRMAALAEARRIVRTETANAGAAD
jgi:heme exporter protein CcmD